jgi:hypothetical protein
MFIGKSGYQGPLVLQGGYGSIHKRVLHRHFGEADLCLPFWLRVLREHPKLVVHTIDSDVLPNVLGYISRSNDDFKGKSIVWQTTRKKQLYAIDMIMVYDL